MKANDLSELLGITMETRMDAEKILFALEQEPDGFSTTTGRIASTVLGSTHGDDTNYLFALDCAIRTLAECHGLLLDASHHDGKVEGLPFNLDYYVWHWENAASNGKFDSMFASENRDYRDVNDETVADAIGGILEKALPAHAIPAAIRFFRSDIPALDAELFAISCEFFVHDLHFDLSFTLDTGRGSRFPFGINPEPTVEDVSLTCEGGDSNGDPFESAWNPETAQWSNPLPLA